MPNVLRISSATFLEKNMQQGRSRSLASVIPDSVSRFMRRSEFFTTGIGPVHLTNDQSEKTRAQKEVFPSTPAVKKHRQRSQFLKPQKKHIGAPYTSTRSVKTLANASPTSRR
jgi:hypothetical protein